jgi:pilus assembly protein CpaD
MTSSHSPTATPKPAKARCAAARALTAVAVAALLAGCYSTRATDTAPPTDYRLRHPISITEGDSTLELFIGSKRGGLTAAQRAEVLTFASQWRKEATGGILIDLPAGTANQLAASQSLAEIRSLLSTSGAPAHAIVVRTYRPASPDQFATVRVSYPKMVAQAGPCGLWPDDLGPSIDTKHDANRPYWNHGCATQRNVAAMVANPADLVQPRGETPAYTGRRTVVLDKFRKGESTATVYPDANAGKISDVGQ